MTIFELDTVQVSSENYFNDFTKEVNYTLKIKTGEAVVEINFDKDQFEKFVEFLADQIQ